ncbi:hypothetical protein HMPREF0185_01558 [Brevundimonas diminuta 470-4]|nr:hypothetical protein HMPREF0185_01558 [Brevundimonas diminuta 470-4]
MYARQSSLAGVLICDHFAHRSGRFVPFQRVHFMHNANHERPSCPR